MTKCFGMSSTWRRPSTYSDEGLVDEEDAEGNAVLKRFADVATR